MDRDLSNRPARNRRYSRRPLPEREHSDLIRYELEIMGRNFDVEYYQSEYPDIRQPRDHLFEHFCTVGWFEGRNPSPYFDITAYLLRNPDVLLAGMNPFDHYLRYGARESRDAIPSASPSIRSRLVFGRPVTDWVDQLRSQVDIDFYLSNLHPPFPPSFDPVAHFAYRGWQEGLDPSAALKTSDLCSAYAEAAGMLVNPLLARCEEIAGRYRPSRAWPEVLDTPVGESIQAQGTGPGSIDPAPAEVAMVRQEFDARFYLAQNADVASANIDAFEHFFYTGWREGRNPTAEFDVNFYLSTYPDVQDAGVNPFWHYITKGRAAGRLPQAPPQSLGDQSTTDLEKLELIRGSISGEYYISRYRDVAEAKIDPAEHYFWTGWREGRNPSEHFDTEYYLRANPDVQELGINPLWHYLVAGKAEGRAPKRPGGYRREIIEAAKRPECRSNDEISSPDDEDLEPQVIRDKLDFSFSKRDGFVVAVSHDCYVKVIGGTQIFIADEQRRFAARGYAYLHLSPLRPRLAFVPPDPQFRVQITLDGEFLGVATLETMLSLLRTRKRVNSIFVVHCVLGFSPDSLCDLHSTITPGRSVFWLHDYSSLCEGYNLLRNDLAFCNAPPTDSLVCRVCVYGDGRKVHLSHMRRLFEHCKFEVAAPSEVALNLWLSKADLPVASAFAHPHWTLLPKPRARARGSRRGNSGTLHIAFVGFPFPSKGWQVFEEIVRRFGNDSRFKFYHFAARQVPTLAGVTFVRTEVNSKDRFATRRLLRRHKIDFLAMLSPWPETFSFVAHEGIAAGAYLLCFNASGNVAALVRDTGRGVVFENAADLCSFLDSPEAGLRSKIAQGREKHFEIIEGGTTATCETLVESSASA